MKPGREPSVLWQEGMFLGPQHMQAFAREIGARIAHGDSIGSPGPFGALTLEIEESALERDVFRVEAAQVVFADGTAACFPETASLPQRELPPDLSEAAVTVHLGVPAPPPNVPQIGGEGDRSTRYRIDVRSTPDENRRDATRELEYRELQGQLFFGDEDRSGFECLPIARIERQGRIETRWALSTTWIGPVLASGASRALWNRLQLTARRLRAQARDLAAKVPATTSLAAGDRAPELLGVLKLQAINQGVATMDQIADLPHLHPFAAWSALLQTIANLAVFSEQRVVPDLPTYDHAQLDACFARAFGELDKLLIAEVSVPYDTASFRKDPLREGFFECAIPTEWLEGHPVFFLGVEYAKEAQAVIGLVDGGVKLVAGGDIERVLQGVVPGIALVHQRVAPLAFPKRPDLHYFRVDMEGPSRASWLKVLESRSAALLSALSGDEPVQFHFFVELG